MNDSDTAVFLNDLHSSKRLGNYKPISGTRRLIGPDIKILAISFTLIFIPTCWTYFGHLAVLTGFLANILQIVLFWGSMCLTLYILIDTGTSDSGLLPKSVFKVNTSLTYFIDTRRPAHGLIKLKTCKTCNIVRPPRSFHCKKCDICVEVHDHHCPWTGTCIGRRTHKKFIFFLAATFQHCIVGLVLANSGPQERVKGKPIYNLEKLSFVALHFYSGAIGFLMFFFSMFHWYLASKNTTTNEKLRGVYAKKPNPWNIGFCQNMSLFWSDYPNTLSNIYDQQKIRMLSSESNDLIVTDSNHSDSMQSAELFYYAILRRYGKLLYTEQDEKEEDIKEYMIGQKNNMFIGPAAIRSSEVDDRT